MVILLFHLLEQTLLTPLLKLRNQPSYVHSTDMPVFLFFSAKANNLPIKFSYHSYEVTGNLQLNYEWKCPLLIVLFRNLLNYCNIMICST